MVGSLKYICYGLHIFLLTNWGYGGDTIGTYGKLDTFQAVMMMHSFIQSFKHVRSKHQ